MKAPRNSKTHRWGVVCRSARGQLPSLLGSSVQGAIRVVSSSSECCGISTSTREAEQGTGHHVLGFYTFNNFFCPFVEPFCMGKAVLWGRGCNSGSYQNCKHIQVTHTLYWPSPISSTSLSEQLFKYQTAGLEL